MMVGLAALTLLSRWPYRARMLYNWDAVQFALALREFDVAKHQPHPPGYLLYVALGRLLNIPLGDPNLAYVALAMVFSAATTVAVYWLARALYDRVTAAAAATLLAVSPLFWFYGSVGLTYAGEAFGASLVAAFAYGALRGNPRGPLRLRGGPRPRGGHPAIRARAALPALRRLRGPRCPELPAAPHRRHPHGGGRALVVSAHGLAHRRSPRRISAPRPSSTARWCFRPRCSAARWT